MSRRPIIAALGVLLLAFPLAAQAQSSTTRLTESENPINDQGSNYDYRSYVTGVTPNVPGVSLQVLEFADRLILTNHSGQTVTVLGYDREPYGRVLADGTVQLNTRSPAYYLNQSFYGDVNVPASASATATPHWTVLDRTGRLEWHDHRIHWMSPVLPPQVENKAKRTKIFDWRVPIEIGTQRATVNGELFWTPARTSAPAAAIPVLVALVLLGLLFVLLVRRRRLGAAHDEPRHEDDRPRKEAW